MSRTERGEHENRKHIVGVVTSAGMEKTITVKVDRLVRHPQYRKYVSRSTKHYAHDEKNEALVGDTVEIAETRPLSKLKRWRLIRVMARVAGAGEATETSEAGTS